VTRRYRKSRTRQAGISYAEALLAVVILGAALAPALQTLDTALNGANVSAAVLQARQLLATRLENTLAEPFAALDAAALAAGNETTPSSYSDPSGGANRVLVFVSRYDGDNADGNGNPFDGTDAGLLWVRVAIENTPYELTTLVAQ
jgi:type II secretory pathway pseudopilin PulG